MTPHEPARPLAGARGRLAEGSAASVAEPLPRWGGTAILSGRWGQQGELRGGDGNGKVSSYLPPPPLPPGHPMYRQEPFCARREFRGAALCGEEGVKMSLGRRPRGSGLGPGVFSRVGGERRVKGLVVALAHAFQVTPMCGEPWVLAVSG